MSVQTLLSFLSILLFSKAFGQDTPRIYLVTTDSVTLKRDTIKPDATGLLIVSTDTIELGQPASKKIVAYKSHAVVFLLDFAIIYNELIRQSKNSYHTSLAKELLRKISKEIQNSDTAYIDQQILYNVNWDPFEYIVCDQLESKRCLIRDSENHIHHIIIKKYGLRGQRFIMWSGWLFFIPGNKIPFKECTRTES